MASESFVLIDQVAGENNRCKFFIVIEELREDMKRI
jgi:hypothetical protein